MAKTKIKPGPHRLLIIPHDKETEKNGLIIPAQSRDWGQIGVVTAIGEGVTFCKEGDTVIYGNYLGIEITYEKQVYIMLYDRELYGLVESD